MTKPARKHTEDQFFFLASQLRLCALCTVPWWQPWQLCGFAVIIGDKRAQRDGWTSCSSKTVCQTTTGLAFCFACVVSLFVCIFLSSAVGPHGAICSKFSFKMTLVGVHRWCVVTCKNVNSTRSGVVIVPILWRLLLLV